MSKLKCKGGEGTQNEESSECWIFEKYVNCFFFVQLDAVWLNICIQVAFGTSVPPFGSCLELYDGHLGVIQC